MANQPSLADHQYAYFATAQAGTVAGAADNAIVIPATEALGRFVTIQTTGTFSATGLEFLTSNDGTNYEPFALDRYDAAGAASLTATATSQLWGGIVPGRYFRADQDGAGAIACTYAFSHGVFSTPRVGSGVPGAGTITGTVTTAEARPSSAAITSVGDSASSITVLAANANRKGASFYNISTAILYLHLGGGTAIAATASSVAIAGSGGYFELPQPCMTNAITGIWASDAGGVVNVTEW